MKTVFKIITRTIWCILSIPITLILMGLWFFGIIPITGIGLPLYFIFTGKCLLNSKFADIILNPDWTAIPAEWLYHKLK